MFRGLTLVQLEDIDNEFLDHGHIATLTATKPVAIEQVRLGAMKMSQFTSSRWLSHYGKTGPGRRGLSEAGCQPAESVDAFSFDEFIKPELVEFPESWDKKLYKRLLGKAVSGFDALERL